MGIITSLARSIGSALSPEKLVSQLQSLKLPHASSMSFASLPVGGNAAGATAVVMRGVGSVSRGVMFATASTANGVLQTALPPCYTAAISSPLFQHKKGKGGGVDKVGAGIIS